MRKTEHELRKEKLFLEIKLLKENNELEKKIKIEKHNLEIDNIKKSKKNSFQFIIFLQECIFCNIIAHFENNKFLFYFINFVNMYVKKNSINFTVH